MRSRRSPSSHGGDRKEARRNQRERLFAAMVAACDEKGFEAIAVEDLLQIAGVSRATFYENFDDKLACFCAAEEEIVGGALASIGEQLKGSGDAESRAKAALEAFVELVVAQPAAARMCLLESYAADGAGIVPVQSGFERVVQLGREVLAQIPGRQGMPDDLTRGIVSGFFKVVFTRLQRRAESELPGLVDPLWQWAMSYPPPSRPLRRSGRRGIVEREAASPPFAAYSPEQRIIRAFAQVVAVKGYPATTIADIAAAASISQTTFYSYFTDKADALTAALDSSGAQLMAATLPSARRANAWPQAVRIGFEAICGFLAAEPDFAQLRLVGVLSAGPEAIRRRDQIGHEFVRSVTTGAAPRPPELVLEAIIGGVFGLMGARVQAGNVTDLPEMAPVLTYLALAPLLGGGPAAEVAAESGPAPRRDRATG